MLTEEPTPGVATESRNSSKLSSSSSSSALSPSVSVSLIAGEYSCLKVDLLFKREFSYYLIQIYIPCCMLVIVSWVSFWLDQGAVPARVSLGNYNQERRQGPPGTFLSPSYSPSLPGVTTLLTMATQTSGINASLPPVSYTKAIDVWTGVCLTFVFGALLEFALVNYASRSGLQIFILAQGRRLQTLFPGLGVHNFIDWFLWYLMICRKTVEMLLVQQIPCPTDSR